jgi:hypothetical protein
MPAAAAAAGGLEDHRIAEPGDDAAHRLDVLRQAGVGSGHAGHPRAQHRALCRDLVAHHPDAVGLRPDEGEAGPCHRLGEVGILGQEAVTRMDRPGIGRLGRKKDRRRVEIGPRRRRRADADCRVGTPDVWRLAIGFRVGGDRPQPERAAGPLDAKSDLAAVGDED